MTEAIRNAALNMDWQQVVLNGGPPCFHLESEGRFCGRTQRWHVAVTDDLFHTYTSLHTLLDSVSNTARVEALEAEVSSLRSMQKVY